MMTLPTTRQNLLQEQGSIAPRENQLWARTLDPEKRAAIRELHRLRPARNLIALLFFGAWAGMALLSHAYPYWPIRAMGYLVIGTAIHALAILMHEGSHGNLFRHRALDRWYGYVCGVPALLCYTAYRIVHQLHHRHTRSALDPEEFTNLSRRRWVHCLAFYLWALVGAVTYVVLVPVTAWTRGHRRDRIDILVEYALFFALGITLFAAATAHGWALELLHSLVIPWAVVTAFTNVRGWAEHAMTDPAHPLTRTRVVTSNRIVSFLMCNTNYHLEHHLYPSMPWYNLRKLHVLLQDEYRQTGSFVESSYLRFLWDGLRAGVHGHTRRLEI